MKITITEKDLNKANQIRQSAKKSENVNMATDCLLATTIKRIKNPDDLEVYIYRAWIDGTKYYIPEHVTKLIELWLGDHIDKDKMKAQNQAVLAQLPLTFNLLSEEDLTLSYSLL